MHKFICHLPFKPRGSLMNFLELGEADRSTFLSDFGSFDESFDERRETYIPPSSVDSLQQESFPPETNEFSKWKVEVRAISRFWGIHRFDEAPWSEKERPYQRIRHFADLKLTDSEKEGVLSKRMIACCLNYLERSPYDLRFALCKCQLPEKSLVDISALRTYHYLQYLDLSHNQITTLTSLDEMPYLQYLDVSHNLIEDAFDFTAPLYLTTVNYSNNRIFKIPDLSRYWSITSLDMSFNCLKEITGLENLKYLLYLNLAYNKIKLLENVGSLRLMKVDLSHNRIFSVEGDDITGGLGTLNHLTDIDLSHNKLFTLKFFQLNEDIENINVSHNRIKDILEVYYLRNLTKLKKLNMSENALCGNSHFKALCISTVPSLRELNDVEITADERIEFSQEIYNPLFPAHCKSMELMLLEQLNTPKIGAHVVPYGDPAPSIIVLVGPPASRKKDMVNRFAQHCDFLKVGISYTTRQKRKSEIPGKDYTFVSHKKFIEMVKNAEFFTVSEFNGDLYGIAHKELEKATDSISVFYSDLETGLILLMAGLNPKLVLTLPRSEKTHVKWLKETYIFEENQAMIPEISIKSASATQVEYEGEFTDYDIFGDDLEVDDSFDFGMVTSSVLSSTPKRVISSSESFTTVNDGVFKYRDSYDMPDLDRQSSSSISETKMDKTRESRVTSKTVDQQPLTTHETHQHKLNWKAYVHKFSRTNSKLSFRSLQSRKGIIERLTRAFKDSQVEEPENEERKQSKVTTSREVEYKGLDDEAKKLFQSTTTVKPFVSTRVLDSRDEVHGKPVEDSKSVKQFLLKNDPAWTAVDADVLNEISVSGETESESQATFAETIRRVHGNIDEKRKSDLKNLDDDELKEKQKRVSFNYSDDSISYGESFLSNRTDDDDLKSVSNTHILRNMQNLFFDNPLLSVLSASELKEPKGSDKNIKSKTAYMTLAQRFDEFKTDKLAPFLAQVMLLRRQLLHLHFENPGLFQTVIFTDDHASVCMAALKQITKQLVESHNFVETNGVEEDPQEHEDYIAKKLDALEIHKSQHMDLYGNMDIS